MKKILIFLALFAAAVMAAGIFFKDAVLKFAMEQAVTRLTGFPTTLQSIHYQFPEAIQINGLKIKNPPGFEREIFADIPEIYIEAGLGEILRKESLHLREVRLNIQEINIERDRQGITNLQKLSSVGRASGGRAAGPVPAKSEKTPFLLDKFILTMRRVGFENHGAVLPGLPVGAETTVDMNVQGQEFKNITDPLILVNLIVMKILYGTTFGRLAGLNPDKLLGEGLQSTFQSGQELFTQTAGLVTGELGNLSARASGYAGTAKGQLSGYTNEGISGVSSLFGKVKSKITGGQTSAAAQSGAAEQ